MKRNIHIEALNQIPLEKQRNELVERKCLGHPDSLADGIAESISQALCKTYLEEFGVVLHHNTDQGEVVAGESSPKFGGGRMIRPIFILIDGRATKQFNGVTIPTDAVAVEAATTYIHKILPELNLNRDLMIDCRLGTGSTDLRDVFKPWATAKSPGQTTPRSVSGMPPSRKSRRSSGTRQSSSIRNSGRNTLPSGRTSRSWGCGTTTPSPSRLPVPSSTATVRISREYQEYMGILKEQITAVAKKSTEAQGCCPCQHR